MCAQYIPDDVFDEDIVQQKMTEMRMAFISGDHDDAVFGAMEFASTVLRVGLIKAKSETVKNWIKDGYDAIVHDDL